MPLTQAQTDALVATERVVSVFSIIGILFILATFYFLSSFNKPINRLVFYASWGNLGMNIACLISEDGIAAGIAIAFASGIYIKAGLVIYHRRSQLQGFLNPLNEHPFTGLVTTDIDVVIEQAPQSPSQTSSTHNATNAFDKDFDRIHSDEQQPADLENNPYSVNIEVGESQHPDNRRPSMPDVLRVRSLTRTAAMNETTNPGAWLYARVAFLFFLSILIVWIPSSVNRVYALAHPSHVNFGLNYVSALVLPAQGLLNVIVYVITSQTACRELWHAVCGRREMPWRRGPSGGASAKQGRRSFSMGFGGGRGRKGSRGDSGVGYGMKSQRLGSEVSMPIIAHTAK
ncbi:MAG: hypothetical protein Q9220_005574 [cf. Caloplaca sp. 1 TL-2023]